MNAYSDKLKDPRWQKKRLEILQRDNWACQKCFDSESTLVVHHRLYLKDKEPWEYPDEYLVTLCEEHHESEKLNWSNVEKALLEILHRKFFAEDVHSFMCGLHRLEIQSYDSQVISDVYEWALSDPDIQIELTKRFFEDLKRKSAAKGIKKALVVIDGKT